MGNQLAAYREELHAMLEMFVTGSTLYAVSMKYKKQINTVRARKTMLDRLNVRLEKKMLPGRGYGTPVYTLGEPIESALEKIDKKIEAQVARRNAKKKVKRQDPERDTKANVSRFPGYGIEGWFFITQDRAIAYLDFCDKWAAKGQKKKDIYGAKKK